MRTKLRKRGIKWPKRKELNKITRRGKKARRNMIHDKKRKGTKKNEKEGKLRRDEDDHERIE